MYVNKDFRHPVFGQVTMINIPMAHATDTRNMSIRVYYLCKQADATYVSGSFYNEKTRQIEVDNAAWVTHIIQIPCSKIQSMSIPCPTCLEKFLSEDKPFCVDLFSHVNHSPDGKPITTYDDGTGTVDQLHWGMSGETGKCYTCAGMPRHETSMVI